MIADPGSQRFVGYGSLNTVNGVLLRVGCDSTTKGGRWNPPVDPRTWEYAYVPIPEGSYAHDFLCPTYEEFDGIVQRFGVALPAHLPLTRCVHLDPDFVSLSIGEPHYPGRGLSSRGRILAKLEAGDFIAFYASFRPTSAYAERLAYCLFGLFNIGEIACVGELSAEQRARCAHGRRAGAARDLVVWVDPQTSGRFPRAIPIGEFRNRAYRVRRDMLGKWGGLSVRDGYIQRSAIPPRFCDPHRFLAWLEARVPRSVLMRQN